MVKKLSNVFILCTMLAIPGSSIILLIWFYDRKAFASIIKGEESLLSVIKRIVKYERRSRNSITKG